MERESLIDVKREFARFGMPWRLPRPGVLRPPAGFGPGISHRNTRPPSEIHCFCVGCRQQRVAEAWLRASSLSRAAQATRMAAEGRPSLGDGPSHLLLRFVENPPRFPGALDLSRPCAGGASELAAQEAVGKRERLRRNRDTRGQKKSIRGRCPVTARRGHRTAPDGRIRWGVFEGSRNPNPLIDAGCWRRGAEPKDGSRTRRALGGKSLCYTEVGDGPAPQMRPPDIGPPLARTLLAPSSQNRSDPVRNGRRFQGRDSVLAPWPVPACP
jgi:hypothetical protein